MFQSKTFSNLVFGDELLLIELDGCLMTLSLFQEQYGIYLRAEKQEESCRGANQGERNMDLY